MSALETHLEKVKAALKQVTFEDTSDEDTPEEDIFEDIFKEDTPEEVAPEEYDFEEDTFEYAFEDTSDEDPLEEDIFEDIFEEDTYTHKVHEIKWEKKVHPDGLIEFITDLHDGQRPLKRDYIRVYTDLVHSFLREHEEKDVLMSFGCTYRIKVISTYFSWFEIVGDTYTCTSKSNTPFIKLGEYEVEEAVTDLLINIRHEVAKVEPGPDKFDEGYLKRVYTIHLGVTGFSIIFKLKEKEEPHIVN